MPKMTFELKLGIFIFIGLLIATFLIFSIGDFYLKRGYRIKAIFNFANGLQEVAPVRLSGVEVGEVKSLHIFYDDIEKKNKVEVIVWIDRDVKIEEDAQVFVNTLGLLGEKYLEIFPGTPGARQISPGSILIGHDSIPVDKITEKSYEVLDEVKDAVKSINMIASDPEVRKNFKALLKNSSEASEKLDRILERADKGEGTVGKFLTDETVYNNIEEFTEDIKEHPWKLLKVTKEKKKKK